MLPAEIYIANFVAFREIRMAIVCQILKILYNPVRIPQKIRSCIHFCCQSCSYQVFLSAGSFRIAIAGRCKFCPSGVRCRLSETSAWTRIPPSCFLHNTLGKFVWLQKFGRSYVTSEMGAHSMWPSFRLSGMVPWEAWGVRKKVWRSPKLGQLP